MMAPASVPLRSTRSSFPFGSTPGREAEDGGRGARTWQVRYFGPTGIGINLKRPGMTMEISRVEEGSPAAATGKLKKGQIIESINGVVLQKVDPRVLLGDIITKAEPKPGHQRPRNRSFLSAPGPVPKARRRKPQSSRSRETR